MGSKWTKEVPDWFDKADYDYANQLTLLGWSRIMSIHSASRGKLMFVSALDVSEEEIVQEHLPFSRPGSWTNDPTQAVYVNIDFARSTSFDTFEIPDEDLLLSDPEKWINRLRDQSNKPALFINPYVPDGVILKDFQAWIATELKNFRAENGITLEVAKRAGRAPSAANEMIDDIRIQQWLNYKILAVLDLDFVAEARGLPKLTNEAIGKLLAPKKIKEKRRWGERARKRAQHALKALPSLEAQTAGDMG